MKRLIVVLSAIVSCCIASGQEYSPAVFTYRDSSQVAATDIDSTAAGYSMKWELEGRNMIGCPHSVIRTPVQSGTISLEIKVNRYGEVSLVTLLDKGTDIIDRELIDEVCEDAMNVLFNEDGNAPAFQFGNMEYNFIVPEKKDTVVVVIGAEETKDEPKSENTGENGVVEALNVVVEDSAVMRENEHLAFKKAAIDGSLVDFSNSLRNTGLSFKGIKGNMAFFEGTFAGVAGAKVFAYADEDCMYKVIVEFPGFSSWPAMKKQYLYFKRSFTSKYFSSPKSVERFPNYIPEGSGQEYVAFRDEAAVYVSTFDVPKGKIVVSIQPSALKINDGYFHLRLEYIDGINSTKREDAAIDDL